MNIVLSLRPYPGEVMVCSSKKEFKKEHLKLFKEKTDDLSDSVGRMAYRADTSQFLVWGKGTPQLAHEFSHVILYLFEHVGIDPREARGEPFCYMLSQLMIEVEHGHNP